MQFQNLKMFDLHQNVQNFRQAPSTPPCSCVFKRVSKFQNSYAVILNWVSPRTHNSYDLFLKFEMLTQQLKIPKFVLRAKFKNSKFQIIRIQIVPKAIQNVKIQNVHEQLMPKDIQHFKMSTQNV